MAMNARAGRPRKANSASNELMLKHLKEHLGCSDEEFQERIRDLSAKEVLDLCMKVDLSVGDMQGAGKWAAALINFQEAKPAQEVKATVSSADNMSDEDLMKVAQGIATAASVGKH